MELKGKKLVLVCPKFYGYENLIAEEIRSRGATVYLVYENIEWVKISYRLVYVYFPHQKEKLVRAYYKKQLQSILSDLDYFAVIRGSSLRSDTLKWVRDKVPKTCQFMMYQWDGVKNNTIALEIAPFFDRVLTFDKKDSEEKGWIYRPLFYIPDYVDQNIEKDIDILFICTLHSNRAKILNHLKDVAKEKGYNLKAVVHLNRILYYKYKYINKKAEVVEADDRDLTFKPLSIQESYRLYSRSKVVVDYTNKNQTGFTMRTIESLGNRCKLITNNKLITESDLYNEHNVHVYNEDSFNLPDGFVAEMFVSMPDDVYEKYTLRNWVNDVIGVDK